MGNYKRRKRPEPNYKNPVELYKKMYKGEIKRFPSGYLRYDTDRAASREIVRFFVSDILCLKTREDMLMKIRRSQFDENKLGGLLSTIYASSPSKAVIDAFPEYDMLPWEFHEVQNNYWSGEGGEERAIDAFHYVFYERLGLTDRKDIREFMNHEKIKEIGLHGPFKKVFKSSLVLCSEKCFPGMFQEWEVGEHVINGYWTREKGIKALKWLFEEHLKLTRDEIPKHFTRELVKEYQLYGMMQKCYQNSIPDALEDVYPGEYKIWERGYVPIKYWNSKTVKEALEWVIHEKKKIAVEDAAALTQKELMSYGLYGLILHEKMAVKHIISKYFHE